ncbi:MAG: endonuclease/exonuclease/phosphatase family protein [Taibaiella sp.]|nr:endonuclease/exonuclease/phosphatase family protein [Taibaiella sp.]
MMKRIAVLVAAVMQLVSLTGCAQRYNGNMLAIAFYNCENFFDTRHAAGKMDEEFTPEGKYHYTERIYRQKVHNIATVIQRLAGGETGRGASLIGLAEVENDHVLNDLVSEPAIAQRHYKYIWFNGPDERGINIAMLYDPSVFRLIKADPVHVSLDGTGGKETTRDVLHAYGVLAGDTVHILVNHWPSRRGKEEESVRKRAIAAGVDKSIVSTIFAANRNARIIIMGDLNDNPTDASVKEVLGTKNNENEVGLQDLYDPMEALYASGQGTLEYKHKWDLFDQIILSGRWLHKSKGWHFDKAVIFNEDFLVDHYKKMDGYPHRSFAGTHWINGYSDHFPVIVYLKK